MVIKGNSKRSSNASMPGLLQKRGGGKRLLFKLYNDKLHVDIYGHKVIVQSDF